MVGGNCLSGRLVYLLLSTDSKHQIREGRWPDLHAEIEKLCLHSARPAGSPAPAPRIHWRHISIPQTAALFFMLAYGMIVHWRISMYRQYQQLRHQERLYSGHVPSLTI